MTDSPTAIRAVRQADHYAEGLARRPHDTDHGGHLVVRTRHWLTVEPAGDAAGALAARQLAERVVAGACPFPVMSFSRS